MPRHATGMEARGGDVHALQPQRSSMVCRCIVADAAMADIALGHGKPLEALKDNIGVSARECIGGPNEAGHGDEGVAAREEG
jgi:hypothetical protein